MLFEREGRAAVGAQHLEDGVAEQEPAVVDADDGRFGPDDGSVDRYRAPAGHSYPFSSASFAFALVSEASFSMARSNICTALALSPCFALISPR